MMLLAIFAPPFFLFAGAAMGHDFGHLGTVVGMGSGLIAGLLYSVAISLVHIAFGKGQA